MNNPATAKRYARERLFVRLGKGGVLLALLFLLALLASVGAQGWRAFISAEANLDIVFDAAVIGDDGGANALRYQKIIEQSLRAKFADARGRTQRKQLRELISFSAAIKLRDYALANPPVVGGTVKMWLPLKSPAERYIKGGIDADLPQDQRGISDAQIAWLETLRGEGATRRRFNHEFFTGADSRDAEVAGIGGALLGSFFTLLLTFIISFPVGVLAAIYLEMFAPRNKWFDFIEININNLAAVPSIIFGLLGLAIFINVFQMPRSSPLVGGLVLSLMTLPTIVIVSRAAIRGVSPSLLTGAQGLGATRVQGVFHFVLPNAMPSILTGAIIGMAQAMGETAPLLLIGMVAFIVEMPRGVADIATALPVQIFLWADSPERGFTERTAAGIMVLLAFLLAMNSLAILLRRKLRVKL